MEISLEAIISLVSLFVGGTGITAFFTLRWAKKKAKAEADAAEAEAERAKFEAVQASIAATKEVQDSYQQLIADMKSDRDDQRAYMEEQKSYIAELKDDRRHLRQERDEQRDRLEHLEETVRDLKANQARIARQVEALRPFACARQGCPDRIAVTISAAGDVEPARRRGSSAKKTDTDNTKKNDQNGN